MVALIAIVVIGGVTIFGQNVSALFIVPAGLSRRSQCSGRPARAVRRQSSLR